MCTTSDGPSPSFTLAVPSLDFGRGIQFPKVILLASNMARLDTCLTTSDFDNLVKSVHSLLSTKLRSSRNAICILLFQLRTGLSNAVIATLCAFKNKRVVSHIIKSAQLVLKTLVLTKSLTKKLSKTTQPTFQNNCFLIPFLTGSCWF